MSTRRTNAMSGSPYSPERGPVWADPGDEILKDLLHQERMLWDVVKASDQHCAAWRDGGSVLIHLSPSSAEGQAATSQG